VSISANCVDMSRWGGELSAEEVACLRRRGVRAVVVGAGDPRGAGMWTRQQATAWIEGGGEVLEAYVYLYLAEDPVEQVRAAVREISGLGARRLWIDAEDVESRWLSPEERLSLLIASVDEARRLGYQTGIYTGRWWWDRYIGPGPTPLSIEHLWDARYVTGATADAPAIVPWAGREYGGFGEPIMYQFAGTTDLCGQSVDLNWMRSDGMLRFYRYPVDMPPGWISGRYLQTEGYGKPHGGVDIAAPAGTPVVSPCEGVVTHIRRAEEGFDFGNWVNVFSDGLYVAFAHLRDFAPGLRVGMRVRPGDPIGTVGSTGKSTGPHLHWAVSTSPAFALDYSQLRDPMQFMVSEEEDMPDQELREVMLGLMRAVPYRGYERFFERCQEWVAAGRPVFSEGDKNARVFTITNAEDALGYARMREFRFAESLFIAHDRAAALEARLDEVVRRLDQIGEILREMKR